jgi:hypothetical protein
LNLFYSSVSQYVSEIPKAERYSNIKNAIMKITIYATATISLKTIILI